MSQYTIFLQKVVFLTQIFFMNIKLIVVGKTDSGAFLSIFNDYAKRINRYVKFEMKVVKDVPKTAKTPPEIVRKKEAEQLIQNITETDYVILLDEKGTEFKSTEFADFLNKKFTQSLKNIVFIIGGAYGFDKSVYERCNFMCSMSKMTFSHQIIRIIFAEQLYRAFTIINNEPYHNE